MAKLTDNMTNALRGARYDGKRVGKPYSDADAVSTGWTMYGTDGRTLSAMRKRGLCMGDGGLTPDGVDARNSLVTVVPPVDPESIRAEIAESDALPLVTDSIPALATIMGDEPNTWAPDMSADVDGCYWCASPLMVALFVDYVGRTEGVCVTHRHRVEGRTYELPTVAPVEPHTDAQSVSVDTVDNSEAVSALMDEFTPMDRTGDGITSVMTVAVIQNTPGMAGLTHYHAPECRDIQREMRRWGQSKRDAFENGFDSVAEILEFEFGDIASDNAESNTPEWWAEIFYNATPGAHGGVKIMPCLSIPNGVTSDGSPLVTQGGFYRAGFKAPSPESVKRAQEEIKAHNVNTCDERECITCWAKFTSECQENHTSGTVCSACESVTIEYDESARNFPCLMVGGVILHKGECAQSHGGNGPVCSLDDDSDAGFVETDSTDDYAIVASLTTSAGFNMITECTACGKRLESLASDHTCEESRKAQAALVAMEDEHMSTMATGTTHHSVDSQGGQWERFEHVLSVGDIVRSTETGRALFEVYALIPGLPVVYVDPCDGREPFPMGATKLYAL